MSEEIYIDGVNVAGCNHRDGLYCNLGVICNGSHCNYKQLQQLKAENKLLKDTIKNKQLGTLAEENERLKEEIKLFQNAHDTEQDRRRKFENCLDEIKEIVEPICEQIPDDKVLRQVLLKISEVME